MFVLRTTWQTRCMRGILAIREPMLQVVEAFGFQYGVIGNIMHSMVLFSAGPRDLFVVIFTIGTGNWQWAFAEVVANEGSVFKGFPSERAVYTHKHARIHLGALAKLPFAQVPWEK